MALRKLSVISVPNESSVSEAWLSATQCCRKIWLSCLKYCSQQAMLVLSITVQTVVSLSFLYTLIQMGAYSAILIFGILQVMFALLLKCVFVPTVRDPMFPKGMESNVDSNSLIQLAQTNVAIDDSDGEDDD